MKKTLKEIAALVGGHVLGDETTEVFGLASIEDAAATDIIFAAGSYVELAKNSVAAAVLLPQDVTEFPKPAVLVEDPKAAFAKLLDAFMPKLSFPVGISEKAVIGKDVTLGKCTIMPLAVVDDHATIKDGAIIYPHVYIGQYAEIGEDAIIYPNATVREHCRVGARSIIHSSATIGSDGFGFTSKDGVHTKVPQVGNVVIEEDCEIGSHVGIDRAAMGSTVIGKGTKIDNLVHIGHNCKIGAGCLIVAQTGISGSTIVGPNVTFGGQVGTVGHIKIGGNSVYAARSGIIGDMPEGVFCAGFPVQSHTKWLRMQAAMTHLPEMYKKIKQLEKKLAQYEKVDDEEA